jgi:hypothetical protein
MQFRWNQIWGMSAIVVGIICIVKRNVPIGFESRPPSFYAKGKWAILLGVLIIILGLFIGLEIPKQMKIDRCLDSGGRYDYKADKCIEGNSTNSGTGQNSEINP